MKSELIKNHVILEGEVCGSPDFDHRTLGENFGIFFVQIPRLSGLHDYIPVMISERVADFEAIEPDVSVNIRGSFRSYNKHTGGRSHLLLSVLAEELSIVSMWGEMTAVNEIELEGYVCKPPIYRKTPLGREIADIMIAVSRPYKKTDYIPCIAWGGNARRVSVFRVGDHVEGTGRIQSREYYKRISETECERRIAYEVSLNSVRQI